MKVHDWKYYEIFGMQEIKALGFLGWKKSILITYNGETYKQFMCTFKDIKLTNGGKN